jgi:hypothetical protein
MVSGWWLLTILAVCVTLLWKTRTRRIKSEETNNMAPENSYTESQIESGLERIQQIYEGWELDDVDIDMLLEGIDQAIETPAEGNDAELEIDANDEYYLGDDYEESEQWLDDLDDFDNDFFSDELEEPSVGVQTNDAEVCDHHGLDTKYPCTCGEVPLLGNKDDLTMKLEKNITPEVVVVTPAKFESVTLTFTSEQEYHDVVAALAAYGRKSAVVSGTSIAADFKLTAYSGNARRTVNALISRLP